MIILWRIYKKEEGIGLNYKLGVAILSFLRNVKTATPYFCKTKINKM